MHASASLSPNPAPALEYWLGLFRPLLTVDETSYLLGDLPARTIMRMLDAGTLRGIDIAAVSDRARQRVPRIFRASVEHLLVQPVDAPLPLGVETLLPHRRPTLRRREVAVLLNCTPKHVAGLELAGPPPKANSPQVHRAALLEFLQERLIQPAVTL